MRELDELTRAISLRDDARRAYPRALPQVTGSLRRESRLLGDEWDSLAAEAQKEEFVLRITELETQFEDRLQFPYSMTTALHGDIQSVQAMLTSRRSDVSEILAGQVVKLRQLKQDGVKVSHSQKDQIRLDMMAMKSEISFLEQKTEELGKLAHKVKADDARRTALEDDSKNWDLWMGTTGQ
jgi:Spy/CpxP family protein refolding chaperone